MNSDGSDTKSIAVIGMESISQVLEALVQDILGCEEKQTKLIVQRFMKYVDEESDQALLLPDRSELIDGCKTRLLQMVTSRSTGNSCSITATTTTATTTATNTCATTDTHTSEASAVQKDIEFCLYCPPYLLCRPQIIFEDDNYIVLNKPWDYRLDRKVNDPPQFDHEPTLIDFVSKHLIHQSPTNEKIVQRFCNQLDYATSGIVLFAKSSPACGHVGRQFTQGRVFKRYSTIVLGHVDALALWRRFGRKQCEEGITLELPDEDSCDRSACYPQHEEERTERRPTHFQITVHLTTSTDGSFGMCIDPAGRPCHTKVIMGASGFTPFLGHGLVPCTQLTLYPHSGRRHQLRISLAALGHPIVGDVFYGHKYRHLLAPVHHSLDQSSIYRMCLHASEMRLHLLGHCRDQTIFKAPDDFSDGKNPWLFVPSPEVS